MFDINDFVNELQEMKKMAKYNLEAIDRFHVFKEKYYTGFICSICSPIFSRQLLLREGKNPLLEVNKNMCKEMFNEKINMLNTLKIFDNMQKLLDLSYCARTNSLSNKNYAGITQEDLRVSNVHMELITGLVIKYRSCIINDKFLMDQEHKCNSYCQNSLDLVNVRMLSVKNIINADNEIKNMFSKNGQNSGSWYRIQKKMGEYENTRKAFKDKNLLIYFNNNELENIFIAKQINQPLVDFLKLEIIVSPHSGVNFTRNSMSFLHINESNFVSILMIGMFIYSFMINIKI